jgi:hypothetical protein
MVLFPKSKSPSQNAVRLSGLPRRRHQPTSLVWPRSPAIAPRGTPPERLAWKLGGMTDLSLSPMTLWTVLVFAIGGAMYVAMSLSSHGTVGGRSTALQTRRPGWIARRRARGGITHRSDRIGVGYCSAT